MCPSGTLRRYERERRDASERAAGPALGLEAEPRGGPRRARRGGRRAGAFEALFKRYHQPLYRYCRAILTDPDDAEDAMQATMVKALRSLPGERREIALRPWLYRVAHNESISILRSRRETAELEPGEVPALRSSRRPPRCATGCAPWSPTWRRCPSASARAW